MSSLNICGGNGWRGFGSLIVPPDDVELFCMKSFCSSLPGSAISITSYLIFFESNIRRTLCCRFFTCQTEQVYFIFFKKIIRIKHVVEIFFCSAYLFVTGYPTNVHFNHHFNVLFNLIFIKIIVDV